MKKSDVEIFETVFAPGTKPRDSRTHDGLPGLAPENTPLGIKDENGIIIAFHGSLLPFLLGSADQAQTRSGPLTTLISMKDMRNGVSSCWSRRKSSLHVAPIQMLSTLLFQTQINGMDAAKINISQRQSATGRIIVA